MMDPEDEQRKRLLIYFKDCVEYKFLQSFFEDLNVDEDHENRAKDELDVEKIQNEEEVNMFEFDQHQDYEWDDTGHLYWYFLDDDNPCVSDCELMSHHILEMQNNEATGECLGSHDGATETVNVTESELSTTEVTVEPDPVLAVPLRDSLPDDMDSDNMELSQQQMQLPLTKLYYSLDPASGTASDLVQVSVRKCLSASALLGTEMYVSTYPFVMAAAAPTVAIFLLVYCEASTTGMLLYEPDPLWLDLVALAYTLDHCTAALKLLLDGPKLVLSSIKVTDVAKAHLALLVVNNYNKIFSTYSYNRYHKFNVKSLVSASLAMLLMLYVANVMYGHTLFMSQHMLLTHLFAMAASVGVFLLVYNKLIFTTSGEYLKLLASACFTLQMALYMAIMVSSNVLLLPLFRLDTGTVLKVDRDYLLLHEKTAAKLHAFPSYKSCMFQNYYDLSTALMYAMDTIIAPYNVDWGARNFCFENLVVIASLYLFNEDHADVTVPLPLLDSCLLPSSDIVSEAKSPFVLVEVEPDPCQLLLGFLASVLLTNCLYFVDAPDPLQNYSQPVLYCHTPEEIYKKMVELLLVELQPDARQLRVMYALDLLTLACLAVYGAFASMTHTNALYFVNEIDLDLTQVHHRYPAFMLPTNALYVADCSEISELAQLSSKLTPPPLLHGLDMDQGCEANLGTVGNQNHVDVTPLAQASLHSAHHYRGH